MIAVGITPLGWILLVLAYYWYITIPAVVLFFVLGWWLSGKK